MLPDGYWKEGFAKAKVKVLYITFLDLSGDERKTHIILPPNGFEDGDVIDLIPLQQKLHEDGNVSS